MKNFKLFFSYLFCFSLFFMSCTEPFHFETKEAGPMLVVYGVITNEYKQHEIRLTHSAPYFEESLPRPVSNAEVFIQRGKIRYELSEDSLNPGTYVSDLHWRAKTDETYTLNILMDGDNEGNVILYQSTTAIPQPVTLDSIKIEPITIMGHNNYALNIYGQDLPEEDYYLFHITVNDTLITSRPSKYIVSDDELFNGQYINGLSIYYFDSISEWEKDSEERRKKTVYLKDGDVVTVYPCRIEKGYYDFITQCNKEKGGENPFFGGPAANIVTNIGKGGVGYFTGYSISRISLKMEETKNKLK